MPGFLGPCLSGPASLALVTHQIDLALVSRLANDSCGDHNSRLALIMPRFTLSVHFVLIVSTGRVISLMVFFVLIIYEGLK